MKRIVFEDIDALASFLYRFSAVCEDWETAEDVNKGVYEFIEAFLSYYDNEVEESTEGKECIFPIHNTFVKFNFTP